MKKVIFTGVVVEKSCKGFTLLETLIVLFILVGLATLTYPSINILVKKSYLHAKARKMRQELTRIRKVVADSDEQRTWRGINFYPDGTTDIGSVEDDDIKVKFQKFYYKVEMK
jgi:prepilin-type N-terminal cleavage/methylation domain-containing protein